MTARPLARRALTSASVQTEAARRGRQPTQCVRAKEPTTKPAFWTTDRRDKAAVPRCIPERPLHGLRKAWSLSPPPKTAARKRPVHHPGRLATATSDRDQGRRICGTAHRCDRCVLPNRIADDRRGNLRLFSRPRSTATKPYSSVKTSMRCSSSWVSNAARTARPRRSAEGSTSLSRANRMGPSSSSTAAKT